MTIYRTPGGHEVPAAAAVVWRELRPVPPHGLASSPRNQQLSPVVSPQRLREEWQLPGRSEHTPAEARACVAGTLRRWRVSRRLVDDLTLIVSELATNAVLYAPGDTLSVAVLLTAREAAVVVVDNGPHTGVRPREAGDDDEHGRGLFLVEALASRYEVRPAGAGTAVWACIQLPSPSTPPEDLTDARSHP